MWVVISDYKNAFDYFCLEKLGPDLYRVFVGGYEVIAYIEDFYDFDTNTHTLPAELLENDIETNADGLILGKNIVENESQNSQKFEQITDPNLKIFL